MFEFLDVFGTTYEKDPALHGFWSGFELLIHPGVQVVLAYRFAHGLHKLGVPFFPRLISLVAKAITGAEIHHGATIGRKFFIDHCTGVIVGETAEIGDNVMIYQGVTLGTKGWWKDVRGGKRHPTLGNNVIVGVGAAVLGAVTVGDNAKIGAHALIVDDIPENAIVVSPKGRLLVKKLAGKGKGKLEEITENFLEHQPI